MENPGGKARMRDKDKDLEKMKLFNLKIFEELKMIKKMKTSERKLWKI